MKNNSEENVMSLDSPPAWIKEYVKWNLLDGESILPYICEEKENGDKDNEN